MIAIIVLELISLCGALAAFLLLLVSARKAVFNVSKAFVGILLVFFILHAVVAFLEVFAESVQLDLFEDLCDLLIVVGWGFLFMGCCEAVARQRLMIATQKTQRALDSLPELIWISDTDKRCTYFNAAWLKFTGRTLEQEIGNGWKDGVHQEDLPGCTQTYFAAFDQRQPFDMEYRLRRFDGEYRWTRDRGVPFYEADGVFAGYIGYCVDITEQRMAERLLKNYSRQHAAVAELGIAALESTNLQELMDRAVALTVEVLEVDMSKILELSESGTTLKLIAGMGWHEGVVGNATVSANENSQAGYTLLTDQPVVVSDLSKESRFRGPALLLDHGVVSGISVIIQHHSKPVGILGAHCRQRRLFNSDEVHFVQAIANVLANAIRQREADKRLRLNSQLLSSVKESLIATDLEGRVTYWGPGAELLYGYALQDVLGQSITLIVPPGEKDEELQRMRTVLETGFWQGQYEQERKDGSSFWAETFISLVTNENGEPIGYIGIDLDITSRKQAEEFLQQQHASNEAELNKARQQLVAKTRFATIGQISAQIAHEMRNPLGAARNAVYFLRRKIPSQVPKVREYLNLIEHEVDTCNRFITDLLEATRPKLPHREIIDLRKMVETAKSHRIFPEGVSLRFSADPEHIELNVDPTQIVQVLDNLIANALDVLGDQGIIEILANQLQDYAIITVQDSGTGIPEEDRDQIFEWMFTSKAKGTGLGLPICRQIVEGHGGEINLQHNGSKAGAAFEIRIPRILP